MRPIDMDKTIVELLKKYQVYIKLLMAYEQARMKKAHYKDELDREAAEQDYLDIQRAYDLFRLIVENPKKYLYRETDIMSTGVDNNNEPCGLRPDLPTISDKFMPLYSLVNQHGGPHVLHMLSSYIAFHVQDHGAFENWIYDGRYDFYAGAILRLNKKVNLMGASAFAKHFKDFLPERMFAVKYAKGR